MKKVLFVFLHAIGDNIMFTPTIRELKKKNPDNEYHVMILKEDLHPCKQVWENNPNITEIHESEIDYHPRFWDPQAWKQVDLPLIQGELTRRFGNQFDETHIITLQLQKEWHRIPRLAYEFGIQLDDFDMDIYPTNIEKERIGKIWGNLFNKKDKVISIHRGASNYPKAWSFNHCEDTIKRLSKKYKILLIDLDPIELQKEGKVIEGKNIVSMRMINPNVRETYELLKRCYMHIGSDSAPMHIACATKTPTIGIFTMTWMNQTAPMTDNSMIICSELSWLKCNSFFRFKNKQRIVVAGDTLSKDTYRNVSWEAINLAMKLMKTFKMVK